MTTLAEAKEHLVSLEASGGKEAAHAWLTEHGNELPEEVRDQLVFEYSTDAFIEDTARLPETAELIEEGLTVLTELQADKQAVQDELAKRDVKDRLGM